MATATSSRPMSTTLMTVTRPSGRRDSPAPAMSTVSHSKITIRQPKTLKAKIAKAAALRGMTVTSFINGMLEIAAERTLRRIETRELTDRDSAALSGGSPWIGRGRGRLVKP